MSFLYPRTVAVIRSFTASGAGALAYAGETKANETLLFQGLPASIQHKSARGKGMGDLPADTPARADFIVLIREQYLARGAVTENDIISDDLGKRYHVWAAYWNSLGHKLAVELLNM